MTRRVPRLAALVIGAALLGVSACMPVSQPASNEQVAAVEVLLRTPADRADFLAMLHKHARAGGLHVDDVSEQWRQLERDHRGPAWDARDVRSRTIAVGLWRGAEDDDPEVLVDDGGRHGRPWLTFLRGKHPELAAKLRAELQADIRRRWPGARDVPVMPSGALPLDQDLTWTGTAYVVKPERIAAYAKTPPPP